MQCLTNTCKEGGNAHGLSLKIFSDLPLINLAELQTFEWQRGRLQQSLVFEFFLSFSLFGHQPNLLSADSQDTNKELRILTPRVNYTAYFSPCHQKKQTNRRPTPQQRFQILRGWEREVRTAQCASSPICHSWVLKPRSLTWSRPERPNGGLHSPEPLDFYLNLFSSCHLLDLFGLVVYESRSCCSPHWLASILGLMVIITIIMMRLSRNGTPCCWPRYMLLNSNVLSILRHPADEIQCDHQAFSLSHRKHTAL